MTDANNTQKLRTVALCFGGGGLDDGLSRVLPRLELSLIVEIEAYAVSLALSRMASGSLPTVPIWTDLKTLRWDSIAGTFDVLTGGFPCQPFSQSGKRKGSDDPRHLWPYIANGLRITQPKLCVFENVDGILSKELGDGYEDPEGTPVALHVLRCLERLGYKATFAVSRADEAGHRHARQRVFFVGVRRGVDIGELGYTQRNGLDGSEVSGGTQKITEKSRMCESQGSDNTPRFVHEKLADGRCGCGEPRDTIGVQKDQTERPPCVPDNQSGGDRQLAHSDTLRELQSQGSVSYIAGRNSNLSGKISITTRVLGKGHLQWGWEYPRTYSDPGEAVKSVMGDAADGLDAGYVHLHREDILRMLGNGVVPDTAEIAIRNALIELSKNQ